MTAAVLTTRTLKRLDEETDADVPIGYYQASEVLTALNAAQRLFVLLTLCLETTGSLPLTAAAGFYRLLGTFSDFLLPLRVRVAGAGGLRVKACRLQDLDALSPTWQATAGVPERYACLGFDLLALYKQPAAGGTSLDITYAQCPSIMLSTSTPEIPEEYHPALIDGAVPLLRLKEGGQEFQKSLVFFARFIESAGKMGNYVRARNLAERYDRLPPDLSRIDMSKLLALATKPRKPAALDIPQAA